MRKFILESILFLSILISIIILLMFYYDHEKVFGDHHYMASIIDKHNRLDHFENNRFLIIGGSNLTFGINSELIENNLNLNVVNLSLHGGLGAEFIVKEAIASIRKGDKVLLSLEYPLFDGSYQPDYDLIYLTQKIYPVSKEFYKIPIRAKFFLFQERFHKSFKKENRNVHVDSIYSRDSFNKYGDEIGHLTKRKPNYWINDVEWLSKNLKRSESLIMKLNRKCNDIGAKLYLAYPTYAYSSYCKNKNEIVKLSKRLRVDLKGLNIINDPETFVFNDSLFYDTPYHLSNYGRERRTYILINIVKLKGL